MNVRKCVECGKESKWEVCKDCREQVEDAFWEELKIAEEKREWEEVEMWREELNKLKKERKED